MLLKTALYLANFFEARFFYQVVHKSDFIHHNTFYVITLIHDGC